MGYCNKWLNGLSRDCEKSKGGVKRIYVTDKDPVPTCSTVREIPEIVNGFSVADGTWYEYNFRKNTASMVSNLTVDPANSVNYIQTDVTVQFNKMDAAKRTELKELVKGGVYVVVVDSNDNYWYLGYNNFVDVTAGSGQSGQNVGDGNFYSITFTDYSKFYPIPLSETAKEYVKEGGLRSAKIVFTVKTKSGTTPVIDVEYEAGDLILSYKAYDAKNKEITDYKINAINGTVIADAIYEASPTDSYGTKMWQFSADGGEVGIAWSVDFSCGSFITMTPNTDYPMNTAPEGSTIYSTATSTLTINI